MISLLSVVVGSTGAGRGHDPGAGRSDPKAILERGRAPVQRVLEARAQGRAEAAAVAPLARPELLAPAERLNTDRMAAELRATNRQAVAPESVQGIVDYVLAESRPGDVLCVLSNGGFGGIHQKLLDGLAARAG